jgi:hypothetical protein
MHTINLLAFSLPFIIFIYWTLLGYATLSLLRTQRNILQNILLAPTVGIAITLLPVFWLNRMGLPVDYFAMYLLITLFIFSLGILWWRKPLLPWTRYFPFVAIFILALFLTGRPLLTFGFNWLSYGNDDMTNYCLGALRFQHYGYSEIPNSQSIMNGSNLSAVYWFWMVPDMIRPGSELLLAFITSLCQVKPAEVFMPLILALHLCLISTAGALILQTKKWRKISLITCFLLALSPLTSLGTLYQLIGQVGGISLLLASCTLLLQPFTIHQKLISFKLSILISLILTTFLIYYPEVFPFLCLSVILYFSIHLLNKEKLTKNFIITACFCFFFLLITLNFYWINIISFITQQVIKVKVGLFDELFPYFLIPSGISNLLGFQTIASGVREPLQSGLILSAFGLLLTSLIIVIKQFRKKIPILTTMTVLSTCLILLFFVRNGFGTFKIAMYIQPFLLATLVISLFLYIPQRRVKIFLLILFSLASIVTQYRYVQFSYGKIGSSFVELGNASKSHLIDELKQLNATIPSSQPLSIDTPNIVSAKLMAVYFPDRPKTFYSKLFFDGFIGSSAERKNNFFFPYFMPSMSRIADDLDTEIRQNRAYHYFLINGLQHPALINVFLSQSPFTTKGSTIILSTPNRVVFNRRKFPETIKNNFISLPWSNASNYIIFINSKLGQDYYLGENKSISLYNFETDYFYPNKSMVGIGRYLLFQTINPSPKIHLALDFTQTFTTNKPNLLPHALVIGSKHQPFDLIGRGSARVFSPAIEPQIINGLPYLMLDMGRKGTSYPVARTRGIMRLFGNHMNLDSRYIVADARDISIISDEEYTHLNPPSMLNKFPEDLSNRDLEYSGTYEDGWISEAAFFSLTQPSNQSKIILKGSIPMLHDADFSTELTFYIDGKKIASRKLGLGNFDIQIPVSTSKGRRKLELHFSKTQSLPNGDDRTVAALIQSIGFENS